MKKFNGFLGGISIVLILLTTNAWGNDVLPSIQASNDIQAKAATSKSTDSSNLVSRKKAASDPRIALYPLNYSQYSQQSGQNHNKARGMSDFVTSSLMIALAKSKKFELLDRSQLTTLFAEKSRILGNKQEYLTNEALAKLPLSDFTLVGSLFFEDGIKFYNLKLIRNKNGEVLGARKYRFNSDNIQTATQQSLDFVHELLALQKALIVSNPKESKTRRKIAFGHFIDISKNDSQLGQGQIITDRLIENFVNNKNYEVLSRTQMLPLVLEEYLRELQYTDEFRASKRANASYLVHGKYKIDKLNKERPLSIYLYLDLIEKGRELVLLKARNWDNAFDLINQATADFFQGVVSQDSAKFDGAKSLLEHKEREVKASNLFEDILGQDQAEDLYKALIKEKYLTNFGNFVQHKKADQVFNRSHTLSLHGYDSDVSIQVFETLRSLNYRPGTQIRYKKPRSYRTRDIHKKLRSWDQVPFLEKHNIEAVLFSNIASTVANLYLNTETSLPSVEFYPESRNESKERMFYRLEIASDAFSSSVYLDSSYLRAKVLLAFSLCKPELGQCGTGNMVHGWIVENTMKANLKGSGGMYFNVTRDIMEKDRLIFLAADAIDRIEDANLTDMFRGTLLQEEYYVKKARKKLQSLIH